MSVKIMGLVWDLSNDEIEREEKYVLLAYADHADHKGRTIFPAIETICEKTGYKVRAAQLITRSLERKGFLVPSGKGPNGTNKWEIPLDADGVKITPLHRGAKNAPVQKMHRGGAKNARLGVQRDAPKPSLTIIKPSIEDKPAPKKANTPAEIQLYRAVTSLYPSKESWETVVNAIQEMSLRLGHDVMEDDLKPFRVAWVNRGHNRFSVNWLDWAVTGEIPQNFKATKKPITPKVQPKLTDAQLAAARADAERQFLQRGA